VFNVADGAIVIGAIILAFTGWHRVDRTEAEGSA
jgi:lipoprotein signal peptidase